MRKIGITLGLGLLLVLAACGKKEPATPPAAGGVKATAPAPVPAGPDRLVEALGKAKADGKNLLLEYYDPTCNFCTQMDKEVWPDEFVKEYLNDVTYLRLVRKVDGKPFEDRFGNLPTPTFVVLKPDGTQVGTTLTGFIAVDGLMDLLTWAANPEGEMPSLEPGGS